MKGKEVTLKPVVESEEVMTRKEKIVFGFMVLMGVGAITSYALWWIQPEHIPTNWRGYGKWTFLANLALYLSLSVVIWHGLIQRLGYWFVTSRMRRPVYMPPKPGLKVAMLTCFVPGKEPYDLLEETLSAMKRVRYPHDTWVLDEGDDPIVKAMCYRLGVRHFSRKGIAKYNQPSGPFKAKTKAGNHNAWRTEHEHEYDLVAQMDMDHIPKENYLERTLGYFCDLHVGFVVAPQIYGNQDNWIARGATEQAFCFHGPIQLGLYGNEMPLFIGTNHVYRPAAIQSVGGYASTIVEDHLTGMRMYAQGWKGIYVPEVIAVGEGPTTWTEYLNQQLRWSYGIFEILFKYTPGLLPKLSWKRRIGFLNCQTYYFTGVVMVLSILLTSFYLLFGVAAGAMNLWGWVLHALPPFAISIVIQQWTQRFYLDPKTEAGWGLKGMFLTLGALPVYCKAFLLDICGRKLQYMVTAKGEKAKQVDPLSTFRLHFYLGGLATFGLATSFFNGHGDAFQLRWWAFLTTITLSSVIFSAKREELALRLGSISRLRIFEGGLATGALLVIGLIFLPPLSQVLARPQESIAKISIQSGQEVEGPIVPALTASPTPLPKVTARFLQDGFKGAAIGAWDPEGGLNNINKIRLVFTDWSLDSWPTLEQQIRLAAANSQVLIVTWEPWIWTPDGTEEIPLSEITDGRYDSYISKWARWIGSYTSIPLIIRFAQEAELTGHFPWATTPGEYIPAWQHVVRLVRLNASNTYFLWSPAGITGAEDFYPGDEFVDFIGATVLCAKEWEESWMGEGNYRQFVEMFDPIYQRYVRLGKPILLPEVGVSLENPDLEANWVDGMLASLKNYPEVIGVVYFNARHPAADYQIDWRLLGTDLDTFRLTIQDSYFETNGGCAVSTIRGGVEDEKVLPAVEPLVSPTVIKMPVREEMITAPLTAMTVTVAAPAQTPVPTATPVLPRPTPSTASTEPEEVYYAVQRGDWLMEIARRLCGDERQWAVIYEANRGIIHNPNWIYPGQVLVIPK